MFKVPKALILLNVNDMTKKGGKYGGTKENGKTLTNMVPIVLLWIFLIKIYIFLIFLAFWEVISKGVCYLLPPNSFINSSTVK